MEAVSTLALLLGGSWASGINLYLTIAGLGLAQRFGWLPLPEQLAVLGDPIVIGIAAALYLIEFVADKIPYVDSAWDSLHTFIRPLGGAILGFMVAAGFDPAAQVAVALITGAIALDSHLTKATGRAALNASPEPFTNIAASVTEDLAVVGMLVLIAKHPYLTLALVILFVVFSFWFLWKMFGVLKRVLRFRASRREEPYGAAGPR